MLKATKLSPSLVRCVILLLILVCAVSIPAYAITFSSDTWIDGSYDGQDIVVHGCTLYITGSHSFHSLTIERGDANTPGVLTHDAGPADGSIKGCALTIETDLTIQGADGPLVASRIDVSGKGYRSEDGPGRGQHGMMFGPGGAYGGGGGCGTLNGIGGAPYTTFPEFGSGGGSGGMSPGGSGGGSVQLTIYGNLILDGAILANGSDGPNDGGAGAGGSIDIEAEAMTGTGTISADGGNASAASAGGGGGGRIWIGCYTDTFDGSITAYGGRGSANGGAGTILHMSSSGQTYTIDNGGRSGAASSFACGSYLDLVIVGGASAYPASGATDPVANLFIGPGGRLTQEPSAPLGAALTVSGNAVIDPGGEVWTDGEGYPSEQGGGRGYHYTSSSGNTYGTGGGHGGYGGSASGNLGGIPNDSIIQPYSSGSGGGMGSTTGGGLISGGSGGGLISLTVSGNLAINGLVTANGDAGQYLAGGGSGGCIRITCKGALSGVGTVSADGGAASADSGGGSGGIVSISYDTNSFTGAVTARGGVAGSAGGAGVVRWFRANHINGSIVIDNGGNRGAPTRSLAGISDDVRISDGAAASIDSAYFQSLHVCPGGTLLQLTNINLHVNTNVTIDPGGAISVDANPYIFTSSSGAGRSGIMAGGGGAYGGNGGNGYNIAGGLGYGDPVLANPASCGSDGGYGGSALANPGGRGAGALGLTVSGILLNNGAISANGGDGSGTGGGGSGGSLNISAQTLTGNGTITANGGSGAASSAGGGGGGRIALSCENNTFTGTMSAFGGTGYQAGGAGSICTVLKSDYILMIDNGGRAGANTPLGPIASATSVTVAGKASACPLQPLTLTSLSLLTGAQLAPPFPVAGLNMTITRDTLVDVGCAISANSLGYPSGSGLGQGRSSNYGSGGGHGGRGGDALGGPAGGMTYGSESLPMFPGSGGGAVASYPGGPGGGRLQLVTNGVLTVNGSISADGSPGSGVAGGGSGGSLLIGTQALAGSGTISASGGAASSMTAGGGGGGRVAVYFISPSSFDSAHVSANGGAGGDCGDPGTVVFSRLGAPVISSTPNDCAVMGMSYVGPTLAITDAIWFPGFTSTTWSIVSGPAGMTISPGTGVVSWPNPSKDASPSTFTIQATNAAGSGTAT